MDTCSRWGKLQNGAIRLRNVALLNVPIQRVTKMTLCTSYAPPMNSAAWIELCTTRVATLLPNKPSPTRLRLSPHPRPFASLLLSHHLHQQKASYQTGQTIPFSHPSRRTPTIQPVLGFHPSTEAQPLPPSRPNNRIPSFFDRTTIHFTAPPIESPSLFSDSTTAISNP